ncbi:hypothetical protein EK0264_09635 [Epidermidibacterium keratini]|uniref:Tetratricopeptide repeat protein n=1 Tax=Epidermidibacterium keratini TaxID=1891644 RepID=A0A7L4YN64_9ACTN|nr:hypothetical protein [Epidermidibacterium keratini]QHC00518.1 hypothetical protein EK0264_09635 [Epidermidibacterium keratini]
MPYTYEDLPEHLVDAVNDITERLRVAKEMDYSPQMEAEAEAAYDEAAAINFPQLMVIAAMIRFASEFERSEYRAGVASYVRLLKLNRQYADYLEEGIDTTVHTLVIFTISAMLQLPEASLAQLTGLIDQLERAHRDTGASLGPIYICRAQVAAERGDLPELRDWHERWQSAERGELLDPEFEARLNVEFYGQLDPARELEYIDTVAWQFEDSAAYTGVERAMALQRLGRADEALAQAHEMLAAFSPEELAETADISYLLRVLEPDRAAALELMAAYPEVFADGGANSDANDLFTLASGARLLLADPATAAEGAALRERAFEYAAAYDARNGTAYHSDRLRTEWFEDS